MLYTLNDVMVVPLIVEDEPIQRMVLEKYFIYSGIETFIAHGGNEAIRLLKENPGINLMITDLHMPDMSGFELIDHVKEINNTREHPIRMIVISTEDKDDFFKIVPRNEVEEYLQKPFMPQDIWDCLKKIA